MVLGHNAFDCHYYYDCYCYRSNVHFVRYVLCDCFLVVITIMISNILVPVLVIVLIVSHYHFRHNCRRHIVIIITISTGSEGLGFRVGRAATRFPIRTGCHSLSESDRLPAGPSTAFAALVAAIAAAPTTATTITFTTTSAAAATAAAAAISRLLPLCTAAATTLTRTIPATSSLP